MAKNGSKGGCTYTYDHVIHHGELVPGAKIQSENATSEVQHLSAKKGTDAALKSLKKRKK